MNSKHGIFTREDIRDLDDSRSGVMALGAHGHRFCAWLRFGGWYQMLLCQREEVPSEEPVEGDEGVSENTVVEVETKPLHCTRAPGFYIGGPRPKQIGHTSGDKIGYNSGELLCYAQRR